MSKTFRAALVSTAMIVLSFWGIACKHTQKTNTKTETAAPPVVVTTDTQPPKIEARVEPKTDFVQPETPQVREDVLPTSLDALNRVAQEKGFIQDAFYNYDEASLSSEAQSALTASATWLKQHSDLSLLVEGHCDERGTEQYNLALGDRRANSAKDYLVTLGVDSSRIKTVSYGEERPFDQGHDEAAWGKNRRAHLVLVK